MALSQAEFNALVENHGPTLYRIAYRMMGDRHEAEDVVQDAFRSAWTSRLRYERGRGDRAWLASILRRRIVDRWRKKRPRTILAPERTMEVSVMGDDPAAEEFSDEVQAALDQLPDELRETLLLVVVGELTHQEVADMMELPCVSESKYRLEA